MGYFDPRFERISALLGPDEGDDPANKHHKPSTLVSRNITVLGHRTSIRLEPEMWAALYDVARRERTSIHNICTLVHLRKVQESTLTAAIRVFLLLYFRAASTEEGHRLVRHGDFEIMKARARVTDDMLLPHDEVSRLPKVMGYREQN